MERREALYSGHVQGVGFRYTAQTIAAHLAVSGYVRNLSDGCVELVAEGDASELDRLLEEIAEVQQGRITDAQVTTLPATGDFERFEIRR